MGMNSKKTYVKSNVRRRRRSRRRRCILKLYKVSLMHMDVELKNNYVKSKERRRRRRHFWGLQFAKSQIQSLWNCKNGIFWYPIIFNFSNLAKFSWNRKSTCKSMPKIYYHVSGWINSVEIDFLYVNKYFGGNNWMTFSEITVHYQSKMGPYSQSVLMWL